MSGYDSWRRLCPAVAMLMTGESTDDSAAGLSTQSLSPPLPASPAAPWNGLLTGPCVTETAEG